MLLCRIFWESLVKQCQSGGKGASRKISMTQKTKKKGFIIEIYSSSKLQVVVKHYLSHWKPLGQFVKYSPWRCSKLAIGSCFKCSIFHTKSLIRALTPAFSDDQFKFMWCLIYYPKRTLVVLIETIAIYYWFCIAFFCIEAVFLDLLLKWFFNV